MDIYHFLLIVLFGFLVILHYYGPKLSKKLLIDKLHAFFREYNDAFFYVLNYKLKLILLIISNYKLIDLIAIKFFEQAHHE